MATLHFFCGKPGAGKSTLARALTRTPAVVVCEDEWIARLGFKIESIADYRDVSARLRRLMDVLVPDILRAGTSVMLDYAANTVERRAWVRTLFERAGADHVLHWLDGSDDECLANVRRRNHDKPDGAYFGPVSDELFRAVVPHFVAPTPEEGFTVARHAVWSPR